MPRTPAIPAERRETGGVRRTSCLGRSYSNAGERSEVIETPVGPDPAESGSL
jgi:hypothetical protein